MKTIALKNKQLLNKVAIKKGLFANLEKSISDILASTDQREVFRGIFLKENGTVTLEIIAESQDNGDEIRYESLQESDFWSMTGLDRNDYIDHENRTVKRWNEVSDRLEVN